MFSVVFSALVGAFAPVEGLPVHGIPEPKELHFRADERGDIRRAVQANPYSRDLDLEDWQLWLIDRGYQVTGTQVTNPYTHERFNLQNGRVSVLVRRLCADHASGLANRNF